MDQRIGEEGRVLWQVKKDEDGQREGGVGGQGQEGSKIMEEKKKAKVRGVG